MKVYICYLLYPLTNDFSIPRMTTLSEEKALGWRNKDYWKRVSVFDLESDDWIGEYRGWNDELKLNLESRS